MAADIVEAAQDTVATAQYEKVPPGQLDSETFAALEQEAGTQTASAAGQTSSD